jgi:hypothetical protein
MVRIDKRFDLGKVKNDFQAALSPVCLISNRVNFSQPLIVEKSVVSNQTCPRLFAGVDKGESLITLGWPESNKRQ